MAEPGARCGAAAADGPRPVGDFELRTLVRNGEQLLLTLIIPVLLLIAFGHENLVSVGAEAGSTSSCPASWR